MYDSFYVDIIRENFSTYPQNDALRMKIVRNTLCVMCERRSVLQTKIVVLLHAQRIILRRKFLSDPT